ncbi:uncharacterized protein LOC133780117 [Humulus lupulus]|uniref:uncharacterized protein LOC133780117 n=1 Tax=Humulus lupulus TaxID=3486 RepID=UPI002B40BDC6|nr:uncharacterized protein LOC133780117 [Humulus lupulus]
MSEKLAGYPEKLLCPCKVCRNLCHQCINILYEHLVIYEIDPTYKIWFHHGEELSRDDDVETMETFDSYNLFRATNIDGCDFESHLEEWLNHSVKFSYRGHWKFLKEDHPFRSKRSWFDGEVEHGNPPRIMNGTTIAEHLKDFVNELYVHHNMDVMHIEKNVCESICNTLLDVAGKSKDGLKARLDLQHMGIRSALHPQEKGTRTYLPTVLHTLSKLEKELFCKRLFSLKVPDGYSSNIRNFVSMEQCKLMGLKSHDCHILMKQLLPVAIKGLMPLGPRDAIIRLCIFFNQICQRVLDRESIMALENDVIETLCLLERFFPPSFFDVMIHLVVHIGREARLCGSVQFRWMYPFERHMKILKDYVRNRARPEGCIAECYLADECVNFCNEFTDHSIELNTKEGRNEEWSNDVILEGRPIYRRKEIILTDELLEIAHRYILLNTSVVEPFLKKHAASYTGYIINGQRFHVHDIEKSTQNSGVSIEVTTMCRSSAKDVSQVPNLVSYYGVIREIILLDYYIVQIPIFKCELENVPNGVRVEDSLTLVNLHQSQWSVGRYPFILASQAKQVFYSREHDSSN